MSTDSPSARPDESDSIAALAAALAKAQGAMKAASKDAENPHFRSKYADLASIWTACREPLSANGLAIMQRVRTTVDGVTVVTMLVHSSGEWVRDTCTFPVAQRTPQAFGSAITYARRYTLAALVGVAADEDDDGNAATVPVAPPAYQKPKAKEERPLPPQAAPSPPKAVQPPVDKALSNRARRVWLNAKNKRMDAFTFQEWVTTILGTNKPSGEWTEDDVARLEVAQQEPPESGPAAGDVPF